MIVSIRGTHGSGKSTIVRSILDKHSHTELYGTNPKKPTGYLVDLKGKALYVCGSYLTACGGCDGINPYSDIWPRIDEHAQQGRHVLFEGALVSSSYGSIGRAMEPYPGSVFAFLDTPLALCIERVNLRRQKAWALAGKPGSAPPVNPANTEGKYASVERTKRQMVTLGSCVRQVSIDHSKAVAQVLRLFK